MQLLRIILAIVLLAVDVHGATIWRMRPSLNLTSAEVPAYSSVAIGHYCYSTDFETMVGVNTADACAARVQQEEKCGRWFHHSESIKLCSCIHASSGECVQRVSSSGNNIYKLQAHNHTPSPSMAMHNHTPSASMAMRYVMSIKHLQGSHGDAPSLPSLVQAYAVPMTQRLGFKEASFRPKRGRPRTMERILSYLSFQEVAKQSNSTDEPLKFADAIAEAVVEAAHFSEPRKLLPIGEGAHQSHEAVRQRTTNRSKACDDGRWDDCFHKDGGDFMDGHSYGHLASTTVAPPTKDGAGGVPPFWHVFVAVAAVLNGV